MIARTHRFHGHNSLSFVYRHGQTVRGPQLALKYVRNQRRATYRAAVVVSSKVHKSAVVRNRLRRRIYEVIREHEAELHEPFDLVFTVFSDQLNELTPQQLSELVHSQLTQAGALSHAVD